MRIVGIGELQHLGRAEAVEPYCFHDGLSTAGQTAQAVDTFLRYHYEQGLSQRRLAPEDIFVPALLDT
jgi:hypothetical protein